MDIVYHLKRFLTEQQDEAAIPNLGVFYVSDTTETGAPVSTGKKIFLFKEKTPRSNAFINYLGYEEKILEAEASAAIDAWVESIIDSLRSKRSCSIPELGDFEILDGKIKFRPAPNQMLDDDFGLPPTTPEAETDKSSRTAPQTDPETPNTPPMNAVNTPGNKHKKVLYTWLIIAAVVVLIFGGIFASYKSVPTFRKYCDKTYCKLQSYFKSEPSTPTQITLDTLEDDLFQEDEDSVVESAVAPAAPVAPKSNQTPTSQSEVSKKMTYHVIAGSFSSEKNAQKFLKKIQAKGFANATLFFEASKDYYMVSLKSFASQTEAVNYKRHEASSIESWVFKK